MNKAHVAHQTIGGESIAIDFESGAYYSMRDSAAEIWQLLTTSTSVDDIVGLYRAENPKHGDAVELAIRAFVAELVSTNLVSEDADQDAVEVSPSGTPIERRPFSTPVLEKFDDMSELIVLDPVHDVTEHGWPHKTG